VAKPVSMLLFDLGDLGEEDSGLLVSISFRLLSKRRIHNRAFIVFGVNGLLENRCCIFFTMHQLVLFKGMVHFVVCRLFKYFSDVYYPLMEELGIAIAGEWEVLIGDSPSIICEGRVKNVDTLIRNLQSKKFRTAKTELKEYIEDYQSRILMFHIQKIKGYKSASYELISD